MTSEKRKENKRSRSRGVSIRWRLLGYLSAFIVFVIAVLYFFQVMMLRRFYEDIKNGELKETAQVIAQTLTEDEAQLSEVVSRCAMEYGACIRVWRVQELAAYSLASADISGDCIIHHISPDFFSALYRSAQQNGGVYMDKIQFSAMGDDATELPSSNDSNQTLPDRPDGAPWAVSAWSEKASALYVQVLAGAEGGEYVIMLDTELSPMSSTVETLKIQFWWIAAVLLIGAVLLAYLMSYRISRPLVRMNEAAGALARGQYNAPFSEKGYRETRELAQTLNYAAEELSKTDRLQKELIANISHDLRTPLTMIRGYGEVMRDLPEENTPENIQVIIDEAEHLSGLVNDLLDLSHLQAGMRAPQWEVFDLTETVRAVMSRYDKLTCHEGYNIRFAAEGEAPVCADRTMILQVVYNLINNAINYCGEDREVEVTLQNDGDDVCLCVCDHGEGIAPEQLPMIWDRYYKVDAVHRRATVGTGLGLSIAKGILELHHARYGVRSTQGDGSEFWFALPRRAQLSEESDSRR